MSAAAPELRSFEELYAEIEALPEGMTGEILDPCVVHVTMGRPGAKPRHTFKNAMHALARFDVGVGGAGWWIEPEPEIDVGAWWMPSALGPEGRSREEP
jgi:hypothetical protein